LVICIVALVLGLRCSDKSTAEDAIAAGADVAQDASVSTPKTLHDSRPAKVFVPQGWDGGKSWPLIILLHGYAANGTVQNIYLGMSQRVTSFGFVLVVPEGTPSKTGKQFWNATNACCNFDDQKIDDVGYLRDLIGLAITNLAIDSERVYVIGHSNGGFMGYRMACEAADLVAGVASIAGAVTQTASECASSRPVNALQIHGTADAVIAFEGSLTYPSANHSHKRWVGLNGCQGSESELPNVDFDGGAGGDETTRIHRLDCQEGTQAALWKMEGSSHIPGFNDAFKDAILEHVLAWRRGAQK